MSPETSDKGWLSSLSAVREVDHLFARLSHYTRFVGYSKRTLIGVTLLLVVSLIAWPLLTKDKSGLRISFVDSATAKTKPASPVMSSPEYRGVGVSGQQYRVTGKTATQQTETLVLIDQVDAQMLRKDGKWYSLTSDRAEYQQDKKLIDLFGSVTVIDGLATQFITSHATVEMDTSRIFGNESISGEGSFGNILASGFEIKDNGNHIIFVGGAKQLQVTIDRKKKAQ